jgi:hypothetical protein
MSKCIISESKLTEIINESIREALNEGQQNEFLGKALNWAARTAGRTVQGLGNLRDNMRHSYYLGRQDMMPDYGLESGNAPSNKTNNTAVQNNCDNKDGVGTVQFGPNPNISNNYRGEEEDDVTPNPPQNNGEEEVNPNPPQNNGEEEVNPNPPQNNGEDNVTPNPPQNNGGEGDNQQTGYNEFGPIKLDFDENPNPNQTPNNGGNNLTINTVNRGKSGQKRKGNKGGFPKKGKLTYQTTKRVQSNPRDKKKAMNEMINRIVERVIRETLRY